MELGPYLALLVLFSEGLETPRCLFAVAAEELLVPVDFPAILVTTGMEKLVREVLALPGQLQLWASSAAHSSQEYSL